MSYVFVVDTNVPIVANGPRKKRLEQDSGASPACRLAAVQFLEELLRKGKIVLDNGGEIQAEYHRHLMPSGEPGVGDRFYLAVLNSALRRVARVEIRKVGADYEDFPRGADLAEFDPSDRKFVAVAAKSGACIANAVDGDWHDFRHAFADHGIRLKFVCGLDRATWLQSAL